MTDAALLAKLREPFPAEAVGKLPRVTCGKCRDAREKVCSDHSKVQCEVCDNYMTVAHMHLDYVGHTVVTSRLLDVDPTWSWEPLAYGPDGLPAHDGAGGLWIRLTICGVTRLGYGDGPDDKQRIGDAIRNAGMRFGIALYLWSKDELESLIGNEAVAKSRQRRPPRSSTPTTGRRPVQTRDPKTDDAENQMSARDRNKVISHFAHLDPPVLEHAEIVRWANSVLPEPVEALAKLSEPQGALLLPKLPQKWPETADASGETPEQTAKRVAEELALMEQQSELPF